MYLVQVVSKQLLTMEAGFDLRSICLGRVVYSVALEQVFV